MYRRVCVRKGCNNLVPKFYKTKDGKKHNCERRKFCFKCSPFGFHNSKKEHPGICIKCGNPSLSNNRKCYSCYFNERQKNVSERVYGIVGYDCWLCGYNKGKEAKSVLEFHHISPEEKLFNLSTREFVGHSWIKVITELQKCVSLCCRCHREYHAGLIAEEEIGKIHKERWEKIGKIQENLKVKSKHIQKKKCKVCNKPLIKTQKEYCSVECSSKGRRKRKRPSKKELSKEIKEHSFLALGKKYQVSDNAIRKWAKSYGLM